MATLEQSMTWALYADRIRAAVGACDPSEDDALRGALSVVTVWSDAYLNNDFKDCDGVDLPIPDGVVYAIISAIKQLYDIGDSGTLPNTSSVRTRDLAQSWAGGFNPEDTLYKSLCMALYPYRRGIWR